MRDVGFDAQAKIGVRGMSLFDGIACPLVAAAGLGIPVEEWIVCERERDATKVVERWHGASVRVRDDLLAQDVCDITEQQVMAAGRIDWFMASPPCTDLSRVKIDADGTDHRKGLAGPTGRLFVKCLEVWQWVRKHNPECRFLVENVDFEDLEERGGTWRT